MKVDWFWLHIPLKWNRQTPKKDLSWLINDITRILSFNIYAFIAEYQNKIKINLGSDHSTYLQLHPNLTQKYYHRAHMHTRPFFRFLALHLFGLSSRQGKWPEPCHLPQTEDGSRYVAKSPFLPLLSRTYHTFCSVRFVRPWAVFSAWKLHRMLTAWSYILWLHEPLSI